MERIKTLSILTNARGNVLEISVTEYILAILANLGYEANKNHKEIKEEWKSFSPHKNKQLWTLKKQTETKEDGI